MELAAITKADKNSCMNTNSALRDNPSQAMGHFELMLSEFLLPPPTQDTRKQGHITATTLQFLHCLSTFLKQGPWFLSLK